jgi:hypothetical protein
LNGTLRNRKKRATTFIRIAGKAHKNVKPIGSTAVWGFSVYAVFIASGGIKAGRFSYGGIRAENEVMMLAVWKHSD